MTSLPKGQTAVLVWSDDDELKALVNDDGEIPVSVENFPTTIQSRAYGWDGATWRKSSLLWGFSERWSQWLGETKDGDGQFSKSSTAVPVGYIYVIQAAYIKNETGARGAAYFRAYDGGIYHPVVGALTPAQNEITTLYGPFVLEEGDKINLAQDSCLNNDVMVAGVWGYKMKVAE